MEAIGGSVMSHKTGDYIVYNSTEICLIGEVVKKCFDGINEQNYYRLIPQNSANASYYIPEDRLEERVRPLLTKDEIYAVIDRIPDVQESWIDDKNERKSTFSKVLRSDDYSMLLVMIKSLYTESRKRSSDGKKLMASDEKALAAAQKLMHSEFAFVLGISEDSVGDFIHNRLSGRS